MRYWGIVWGVILVWGVTFVNTRALLADFSSFEILVLRFVLACATLCAIERVVRPPERHEKVSEWIFVAMGITGFLAYHFLENCAIYYTNASNVAILTSFAPVATAILARVCTKNRQASIGLFVGSLIAIGGVALVSLNGQRALELRPIGDVMAICSMVSWAFYSLLIDVANRRGVSPLIAVRKALCWSLVMIAPLVLWGATEQGSHALDGSFAVNLVGCVNARRFVNPLNWANIAMLGILASAACFVLWSVACKKLGVVKTSISLYLIPVVGVVFAMVALGERVTFLEIAGGCVILIGMTIATKRSADNDLSSEAPPSLGRATRPVENSR